MAGLISEITYTQADLIKSFAIFYLLLVGNYVTQSMFTCFQIKFITIHKSLQLFFAFLLFYFLVTLISNTGTRLFIPPIEKLLYSVFYFFGFLLVMRLNIFVTFIALSLIFIIYFLELNKEFYLDGEQNVTDAKDLEVFKSNYYWITINWPFKLKLFPVKKSEFRIINKVENIIFYIIMVTLIIGFISYGGELKDTIRRSKKQIRWIDIITDSTICKLKDRKTFWQYFKLGLGVSF
jgi:hypothetical protein